MDIGIPGLVVITRLRIHSGHHHGLSHIPLLGAVAGTRSGGRTRIDPPVKVNKAGQFAVRVGGQIDPIHGSKQILGQKQIVGAFHLGVIEGTARGAADQNQQPVVASWVKFHRANVRAAPVPRRAYHTTDRVAEILRKPNVRPAAYKHNIIGSTLLRENRSNGDRIVASSFSHRAIQLWGKIKKGITTILRPPSAARSKTQVSSHCENNQVFSSRPC
mmetsp:Transcript_1217/g.1790  ORF Transcript_1217/g.1790 Transcript_1217/m.1790 type:complete len:217 (-) Transcript_1217:310-960(-)